MPQKLAFRVPPILKMPQKLAFRAPPILKLPQKLALSTVCSQGPARLFWILRMGFNLLIKRQCQAASDCSSASCDLQGLAACTAPIVLRSW